MLKECAQTIMIFPFKCCFSVLLDFMEKKSRRPEVSSSEEDSKEILAAKSGVLDKIAVPSDKISDDFAT